MKRFLVLLAIFSFICMPVSAEDVDFSSVNDLWNIEHPDMDREVKTVSDEEFDKAVDEVDAKVNKWKNRIERWRKPRGNSFSQSNETEQINNETSEDAAPVVCIPVNLEIGNAGILPMGHYQVRGELNDGKAVLKLYQAHYLMAKIPATQTEDDFGEEEILFAKLIPQNDNTVKIIYGSLDFNAYAFVNVAETTAN